MISSLGTILDNFQGLISKGFVLAGMLPAVVFVSLNLTLVFWAFPESREPLRGLLGAEVSDLPFWLLVLVFVGVLGLVFWSINPWIRTLLEGQYLPKWFRAQLLEEQRARFAQLERQKDALFDDLFDYRKAMKTTATGPSWEDQLEQARETIPGTHLGAQLVMSEIRHLKKQFDTLSTTQAQGSRVPFAELESFFTRLKDCLKRVHPSHIENGARPERALNDLQLGCLRLLEAGWAAIEGEDQRLGNDIGRRFPVDLRRHKSTRLANLTEVHREYALARYGLDIELFWLRLLKIIREDDVYFPLIEEAKTQLDLSVAATGLVCVTTLVWSVVSLFSASIWPFLGVTVVGPLATWALYLIVLQTYGVYTETVRGAVDLHRLALLEELHMGVPANSKDERTLWTNLAEWSASDTAPITFHHPAAGNQGAAQEAETLRALAEALRRLLDAHP